MVPDAAPYRLDAPAATGVRTLLTVGVTAHDRYWLGRIGAPHRFAFVPIGDFAQADDPELCRPAAFVDAALDEIRKSGLDPAGIIACDDYPASLLSLAIGERLGLPGPSLAAAVLCSHKAWSRLRQRDAVPAAVPRFQVIDPGRDWRARDLELPYPFWLKPVKSSMSYLGFRIDSFAAFERALAATRAALPRYAAAFQSLMDVAGVAMPGAAAAIGGHWLIAEELLGGAQCTLDGMMLNGNFVLIGIVDSIRLRNRVSFTRFDYPSRLPAAAQRRMIEVAETAMRAMGFDNGLFNVEFFLDRRRGPTIIEINPRFSPQFTDLFEKVDGTLSHQYVAEIAAGVAPTVTRRQGRHGVAASFVLRRPDDAVVRRIPTAAEIAELRAEFPDLHVEPTAAVGDRLSERVQDMYTFRYGLVHLGAADFTSLQERFAALRPRLRFELDPVGAPAGEK